MVTINKLHQYGVYGPDPKLPNVFYADMPKQSRFFFHALSESIGILSFFVNDVLIGFTLVPDPRKEPPIVAFGTSPPYDYAIGDAPEGFAPSLGVAGALGSVVGSIGIVIALAAIIGKCLMDSGAADRIVRSFLKALGEKRASVALMRSGFVLSIPAFFDTVFSLLVPLARSL